MEIKRVRRRLVEDFIKSKYHRYNVDYVSAAPLREEMRYFEDYKRLQNTVGETLYVAFSGKAELINFAQKTIYDLYSLQENECLCLSFEDFSIYFITVLHKKLVDGEEHEYKLRLALIDKKRVWYPRKTKLKVNSFPISMAVLDKTCASLYILPELNYPTNKFDKINFIRWLRINKQFLYVRYTCEDYNIGRWCYYPKFSDRWLNWYKRVEIYLGDDIKDIPATEYVSKVNYITKETSLNIYEYLKGFKVMECNKTITQETVDEFIEWQNNRYEILK